MALDYHIRSREVDVNDTAAEELDSLNGDAESKNQSIGVSFTFLSTSTVAFSFFFVLLSCSKKPKQTIRVPIG